MNTADECLSQFRISQNSAVQRVYRPALVPTQHCEVVNTTFLNPFPDERLNVCSPSAYNAQLTALRVTPGLASNGCGINWAPLPGVPAVQITSATRSVVCGFLGESGLETKVIAPDERGEKGALYPLSYSADSCASNKLAFQVTIPNCTVRTESPVHQNHVGAEWTGTSLTFPYSGGFSLHSQWGNIQIQAGTQQQNPGGDGNTERTLQERLRQLEVFTTLYLRQTEPRQQDTHQGTVRETDSTLVSQQEQEARQRQIEELERRKAELQEEIALAQEQTQNHNDLLADYIEKAKTAWGTFAVPPPSNLQQAPPAFDFRMTAVARLPLDQSTPLQFSAIPSLVTNKIAAGGGGGLGGLMGGLAASGLLSSAGNLGNFMGNLAGNATGGGLGHLMGNLSGNLGGTGGWASLAGTMVGTLTGNPAFGNAVGGLISGGFNNAANIGAAVGGAVGLLSGNANLGNTLGALIGDVGSGSLSLQNITQGLTSLTGFQIPQNINAALQQGMTFLNAASGTGSTLQMNPFSQLGSSLPLALAETVFGELNLPAEAKKLVGIAFDLFKDPTSFLRDPASYLSAVLTTFNLPLAAQLVAAVGEFIQQPSLGTLLPVAQLVVPRQILGPVSAIAAAYAAFTDRLGRGGLSSATVSLLGTDVQTSLSYLPPLPTTVAEVEQVPPEILHLYKGTPATAISAEGESLEILEPPLQLSPELYLWQDVETVPQAVAAESPAPVELQVPPALRDYLLQTAPVSLPGESSGNALNLARQRQLSITRGVCGEAALELRRRFNDLKGEQVEANLKAILEDYFLVPDFDLCEGTFNFGLLVGWIENVSGESTPLRHLLNGQVVNFFIDSMAAETNIDLAAYPELLEPIKKLIYAHYNLGTEL